MRQGYHHVFKQTSRRFFSSRKNVSRKNEGAYMGFIPIWKPVGMTSHDCVNKMRHLLKMKRIGHAGTLDPNVDGVLSLAVGPATRLISFLNSEKEYTGTFRFGLTTTSDDMDGEIVSKNPVKWLQEKDVLDLLPKFRGTILQRPPNVSAISINGKRLYSLVRKGEPLPDIPMRERHISKLETMGWKAGDYPEMKIHIVCQAGTYIRSIARDIGNMLQVPPQIAKTTTTNFPVDEHNQFVVGGSLSSLTRDRSGIFTRNDCLTFHEIEQHVNKGKFKTIPSDYPLTHIPHIILPSMNWSSQRLRIESKDILYPLVSGETQSNIDYSIDQRNVNFDVRVYQGSYTSQTFLGIGTLVRESKSTNGDRTVYKLLPKVVL